MSLYINISNYNFFSIIRRIDNLLENNYVINHIKISNYDLRKENITTLEDNQNIPPKAVQLKAQFQKLHDKNIYQIIIFDSYGKKRSTDTYESKIEFKKAFIRYTNGKLYPFKSNRFGRIKKRPSFNDEECALESVLSYHKQRVSKKITSNVFVSNEKDLKIEVYKFLLKKNKEAITIPECSIGNRRADYISFDEKKINCTIVEIKSELDTFERLEAQLEAYSKIANNIYLAIDKKQYTKLISKNIPVPNHVGILIFDNSKKNKLQEIKKAIKIEHKKEYPFIQYLSYSEINNSFSCFKYSSKFSKEQKQIFIEQNIKKEIYNRFAYECLYNRFIIESDKRKSFLEQGDIDSAVASAKELKFNRFDNEGKHVMSFHKYIADKDILYKYFIQQENKLIEEFKEIPNIKEYIKNGSDKLDRLVKYIKTQKDYIYLNGLSNSNIFKEKSNIKIDNQLSFLESLVGNKELVIKYIKNGSDI